MFDAKMLTTAASICRQTGRPTLADYLDGLAVQDAAPSEVSGRVPIGLKGHTILFPTACPYCGKASVGTLEMPRPLRQKIAKEFTKPKTSDTVPAFWEDHGRQLLDVLFWWGLLLMVMIACVIFR